MTAYRRIFGRILASIAIGIWAGWLGGGRAAAPLKFGQVSLLGAKREIWTKGF